MEEFEDASLKYPFSVSEEYEDEIAAEIADGPDPRWVRKPGELGLDPGSTEAQFGNGVPELLPTKSQMLGPRNHKPRTGPRKTARKKPLMPQQDFFGERESFGNRPASYFPTLAGGILYEVFHSTNLELGDFAEAIQRSASNLSTIIRGRRDPSLGTLLRMIDAAGYKIEVVISEKEGDPFPGYLREIAEIPWHEL